MKKILGLVLRGFLLTVVYFIAFVPVALWLGWESFREVFIPECPNCGSSWHKFIGEDTNYKALYVCKKCGSIFEK